MVYDFIKLDGMLNEFKIYNSKIDFEKLFNELADYVKEDIFELTNIYYDFFSEQFKDKNIINLSTTLNPIKKIDNIYYNAHLFIVNDFKYVNMRSGNQVEITKISINICLPSSEHVSGIFQTCQSIYLLDFDMEDENEFKKHIYNILFYCYIIIRDFRYHPLLRYLNHKDEIESLLKIFK